MCAEHLGSGQTCSHLKAGADKNAALELKAPSSLRYVRTRVARRKEEAACRRIEPRVPGIGDKPG